ncbi:hypothetical protein KXD93_22430 [Mucilaginibacter sp. BJC16-A38]|uniref:MauE/DoxX family redox-associated membrane protein n=1 Tax=Mucilaginibacter phenanthrenivorans TaxID=1234842 RepID=UPI00358F7F5B|nr:hypothetical protein [Mucilaginibacter phenanthrenivorans]
MSTFLKSLPVSLLILLFVYAAASKLLNFGDFRGQLNSQVFSTADAGVLVYVLPAAELIVALLLLFPRTMAAGLQLSLALLVLFSGYIALALLHFWQHVPCPCGGILSRMPWPVHLALNLLFICLNITAIIIQQKERRAVTHP